MSCKFRNISLIYNYTKQIRAYVHLLNIVEFPYLDSSGKQTIKFPQATQAAEANKDLRYVVFSEICINGVKLVTLFHIIKH